MGLNSPSGGQFQMAPIVSLVTRAIKIQIQIFKSVSYLFFQVSEQKKNGMLSKRHNATFSITTDCACFF